MSRQCVRWAGLQPGVRGMMLGEQKVISLLVAESDAQQVLTATTNGCGKRTRSAIIV